MKYGCDIVSATSDSARCLPPRDLNGHRTWFPYGGNSRHDNKKSFVERTVNKEEIFFIGRARVAFSFAATERKMRNHPAE